ncbi:(3R)-3-hydroxyacyl-CoA dehydrogenase-like [Ptychodera flava]|uniref:(3R)-3-hydroxyacyl-CoA dehydrogenase-like n=1 Tax=Ptychodera flava TaxID=63121 RepID=UPI00396A8997
MNMATRLNKLAAVVTGGGSGIGRAVCQRFAREGASVAIVDTNEDGVRQTLDGLQTNHPECGHHTFVTDVSSSESVEKLVQDVQERFPVIPTIVVNCAGITRDTFLLKMREKQFDDVMNVNLKGVFLVTQAMSRLMVENKVASGSIINVSSITGKVGNIGQCNYSASKAGVIGFTKTVALELGRFNIRCNAILPGWIETPMTQAVPDKVKAQILPHIPLRRIGRPEEIADVCMLLATNEYMTGTSIEVTGGIGL